MFHGYVSLPEGIKKLGCFPHRFINNPKQHRVESIAAHGAQIRGKIKGWLLVGEKHAESTNQTFQIKTTQLISGGRFLGVSEWFLPYC